MMSDPFNPRRFVYEANSHSDPPVEPIQPPPTGRVKTINRGEKSHPRPAMVQDAKVPSKQSVVWIIVCTLLVAICSYLLGRVAERSSVPSPQSGVSPDVRAYVDEAILRLSRDPVGRPDFALYANGGRVIRDLTGVVRDGSLVLPFYVDNTPNVSLTDDAHVGRCWMFPQQTGQLSFRTSEMLFPTHVTVDHIPIEISADIGQAPRTMALWGAIDGRSNTKSVSDLVDNLSSSISHFGRTGPLFTANLTFVALTTFEYDIYSPNNVQTFPLDPLIVDAHLFFGVFILDIFDNWGGETTCLYRVRIHGESALQ